MTTRQSASFLTDDPALIARFYRIQQMEDAELQQAHLNEFWKDIDVWRVKNGLPMTDIGNTRHA